jgi:hypothetical protein
LKFPDLANIQSHGEKRMLPDSKVSLGNTAELLLSYQSLNVGFPKDSLISPDSTVLRG